MMFNADEFYPTPETLIADMLMGIDFDKIQTILEPSAGKGDIVKRIRARDRGYGRTAPDIDAIEISPELRHILKGENIRVVHDDYGDLEPEARDVVKSFDGGEVGYTHTVANREYFLFKPEKTLQLEYSATPA